MLTIDQEALLYDRIKELQLVILKKNEYIRELEADLLSEKVAANQLASLIMQANFQEDGE